MKNTFLNRFDNNIKILVEGKNINNYIKRIIKNNIEIINLKYLDYNKVELIIRYNDYKKLKTRNTIYKIKIIDKYGKLKLKDKIKQNHVLIITTIIGIALIIFLSKFIFNIEIIHTNKEIIKLLENELYKNDIKKYSLKKSYNDLEKIKKKILNDNKDKLEWLEIEVSGTKYIVRVEERKIINRDNSNKNQDIVMRKSGVLKKIISSSGEKVKELNTFVKEGETVISGTITKPNGEQITTSANGLVYANVWYTVEVEYPYHYKEEKLTGKNKEVYYINFINKRIGLFNFNKFSSFNSKQKVLLYNSLLPISFIKEKQYELNIIDEIYTEDEVINKAIELSESRLLASNKKIESIDSVSVISKDNMLTKIKLKLFLNVTEEVSEIRINEGIELK